MKMKTLFGAVVAAVSLGFAPVSSANTYWRWTSNATEGDSAVWNVEDNGGALSVPAFTGATAEDNVIELVEDCKVTSILTFLKSCTIRTRKGLDARTVLFTGADVHCLVGNAAVKASNVTFDGKVGGAVVGNAAWGLTTNGGSLTLGDGVTVCNFKPAGRKINSNFDGAIVISAQTATLDILEGAKICDISGNGAAVTVCNGTTAVVNLSGGEITRCTSMAGNRGGGAIDMDSGTLNLSGGSIRGNTAACGAGGVCVVNDGRDGYIKVSGNPVVRDNVLMVGGKRAMVANVGLTDGNHAAGHFVLAGNLAEGAYVGCSYNVGAGKAFGKANGNCAGAEFIHADGNDALTGQRSGKELRWVRSGRVDISGCWVSAGDLAYTGGVQSPQLTVEEPVAGGATLKKDVDYTISGTAAAKEAGTHYLVLRGRGDFVGAKIVGWRIVKARSGDADSGPVAPPLDGGVLRFSDTARRMNVVAERDLAVDGILFGESTRTKISGGHAITVNVRDLAAHDKYKRIFLGNCELTLAGAGTRLTVNPNVPARQSRGLWLTAEDGAKFMNPGSDFGDNCDFYHVARGHGSEVRIGLGARPAVADNCGFEAHSGGLVALTGRHSLGLGGINHAYVAEGGTLDLPAVRIRGGAPTIRIVGSGSIALGAANVDGGTVTLKPDSSWNGSAAHLTVAGDLSLGANVRYAVDFAGFPDLAKTDRIAFARADGKISVTAPKAGVDAVGGDARRVELEAEGDVVYLKLTDAGVKAVPSAARPAGDGTAVASSRPGRGDIARAEPRLKFGVCSDLHLSTAYRGPEFFERALRWWKREGVDAIVIAGDIADCGDVDSCRMATNALTRVFGDDWPKLMVILGNHDKLGDAKVRRDVLRNVFRMGEETDEKAFFTKVKGYAFVGRSWPREPFSMVAFLESHAADLKGPRPFVFVQHPHPTGTCHGPYVWGQEAETAGLEQAADFLKAYPNAVAFSGHSHYQICDERTVWKGDFTSVGTGSMANQGTLPGRENSSSVGFRSVMPAAEACGVCAELVTFYDREMRIQRHEFWTSAEGRPIGEDWRVPFGKTDWTFERRTADSLSPAFLSGAEVEVRRYTGALRDGSSDGREIWEVSFPTAPAHDGRPRAIDYEVTAVVNIYDCEWRAVKRVLSPHYGRTAEIDTSATCLFDADAELPRGGQFLFFEVRPISPFGKAGEPIRSLRFYR